MSDQTKKDGLKCGFCGVTWDDQDAFDTHFPCEEATLAMLTDDDFLPEVTDELIEEAKGLPKSMEEVVQWIKDHPGVPIAVITLILRLLTWFPADIDDMINRSGRGKT